MVAKKTLDIEKNPKIKEMENKWAKHWVQSMAHILALGPSDEPPEKTEEEIKKIEKIAMENGSYVHQLAKKWHKRLLEAMDPNAGA